MELSPSTQLAQATLITEVNVAVLRKGLEAQQLEGQNVLQLVAAAAPSFNDPTLGRGIDLSV